MKALQRIRKWIPFGRQQRNFQTSPARRGGDEHDEGGIPGKNLPFQTSNRWLLALNMGWYMGSGFATPFLLLRHQLKKNNDTDDEPAPVKESVKEEPKCA